MPTFTTDELQIYYEVRGGAKGVPLLLLHEWPDDLTTWNGTVSVLHEAGFRTITQSIRGFGASIFLDEAAPRTADSAILAMDAIALMNGLGITRTVAIGHDWGWNIAGNLAIGWPERIEGMVMLSTPPRMGGMPTPPFWHAQLDRYHWFMATDRGGQAVGKDCRGFAHYWTNWSPPGWFDEATFDRVAASWDNPDWLAITLHNYRSRWDFEAPDPRSAWLDQKVKQTRQLNLLAAYVQGEADGVNPPAASRTAADKFRVPFEYVVLPGVGHFPQMEAASLTASPHRIPDPIPCVSFGNTREDTVNERRRSR